MASNFDPDLYDFGQMTDDEIRTVVLEHFREDPDLDPDDIQIEVRNGAVTLTGRVGTDAEVQIAGSIVDDVLGLTEYSNELVVDPLRRARQPVAADDAAAEEARDLEQELVLQQSDTAEHLIEDLESETFGTDDMGKAIRDASPYAPPDSPQPDGYDSLEDH